MLLGLFDVKNNIYFRHMEKFLASPMPAYFLIRIGKHDQKERQEKIGSLYFPQEYAYMTRKLQWGEIIAIGNAAKEFMPCASIGDYLLFNHFIEGKKTDSGYNFYLIDQDDGFNYYAVNAFEIPGERAMSFGVAIGEEVIPTPDYIFLEVPKEETGDEHGMTVTESGLSVAVERKKTRDEWVAIMKQNVTRIKELANVIPSGPMEEIMALRDPIRKERLAFAISEIKKLETINSRISKDINKKKYEPFVVASVNPDWAKAIEKETGEIINPGDTAYFLNMATHYKIDFSGTTYIVAEVKYFSITQQYLRDAVSNFEHYNATRKAPPGRTRSKSIRN